MVGDLSVPHVLIVDDETDIADEILEYLTAHDLNAETASSGQEALRRLDTDPSISVLLSDIRMPDLNGLELANTALSRRTDENPLEVVILTGHGTIDDAAQAVRTGAVDFLLKPVGLTILESAVRRAAAAARERRERWDELHALRVQAGAIDPPVQSADDEDSRTAILSLLNHEFRTPLGPIVGVADILEHHLESLSPAQIKGYAGDIRSSGRRLERGIRRVTELASLMANTISVQPSPCALSTIISDVEQACREELSDRSRFLRVANDAVTSSIVTDRRLLVRAIAELIENASLYSAKGSAVELLVTDTADRISFAVIDTGKGMTEADVNRALRLFQQLDMSNQKQVDGLGIGLCIANRVARLLGGTLTIASTPGQGTAATIRLPLTL